MGTPNENDNFSMEALFNEIRSIKKGQESLVKSGNEVNSKLDAIQGGMGSMKQELTVHDGKITQLDQDRRRKNVVIFGLHEDPNEKLGDLTSQILTLFSEKLKLTNFTVYEIDFVQRLGKNHKKDRPVLVKLASQIRKMDILRNSKALMGTRISIQPDYSQEVKEKRKPLLEQMKVLRAQGKYAVVRYDKLIVHDRYEPTQRSNSQKRPPSESPDRAGSKRSNLIGGPSNTNAYFLNMSDEVMTQENENGESTTSDMVQVVNNAIGGGIAAVTPVVSQTTNQSTNSEVRKNY